MSVLKQKKKKKKSITTPNRNVRLVSGMPSDIHIYIFILKTFAFKSPGLIALGFHFVCLNLLNN